MYLITQKRTAGFKKRSSKFGPIWKFWPLKPLYQMLLLAALHDSFNLLVPGDYLLVLLPVLFLAPALGRYVSAVHGDVVHPILTGLSSPILPHGGVALPGMLQLTHPDHEAIEHEEAIRLVFATPLCPVHAQDSILERIGRKVGQLYHKLAAAQ